MNAPIIKSPASHFPMLGLSLVICRSKEGKYLAVKENNNKGWWLPGGKVDFKETFSDAAIREAKEEAGIDVDLKGILRVEYNIHDEYKMIKLIYYAEPKDGNQEPKSVADNHSEEARWLTVEEIKQLEKESPGWRGDELYMWGKYLDEGGMIFPLAVFSQEGSAIQFIEQKK